MFKSKIDYLILSLGIIGVILAGINSSVLLILSTALITLIALNRSEARFLAIIIYVYYVYTGIVNGFNISIISIIFWFYICYQMYNNWNTASKRINFIALESYMMAQYANLFLVLIGLNLVMYLIFTGFNLATVFSIPILYEILSSSLQFLGIYLLAMRIREGALFYIGYLALKIIMLLSIIIVTNTVFSEIHLFILVIQALIIYAFYQYNSH